MPRVDNVKYETTKDKVIAWLSKQTASVFTKLAMEYKQLAADLELMNKMKRELTALQNSTKDRESAINAQLKERIPELFNESEQLMTLSVECLGSSFTLSKFAESNKDKVITPAGEIISTDYKAIVDHLVLQGGELSEAVKLLIKQFSVIAESDVIKKGAERRLTVNLESIVQEGVWDKVLSIVNKLTAKFKSLFSGLRSRQNKINSMLSKLNESSNKGKIMLNKSEKQLVKEYAKKLISKRKLNESIPVPTNLISTTLRSYLTSALWSSTDENGDSLDDTYTIHDFDSKSVGEATQDIKAFLRLLKSDGLLNSYLEEYNSDQLGHDFWLTRNGHGAGFWDRTYEDDSLGDKLTKIAKKFGEVTVVVGDDGKLYFE